MDVQMRHFQTGDQEPGARRVERFAHGLSHRACNCGHFGKKFGIDVLPLIYLGTRNYQYMALCHRRDSKEGNDVVVLPHKTAR